MTPATDIAREGADLRDDRFVLVKRGLFYRPHAQGYTGIRDEAGIYSFDEAGRHADPESGIVAMPLSEAPEFMLATWPDLKAAHLLKQRATLTAALGTMRAERDEARKDLKACLRDMGRGGQCTRVYSDAALGQELEAAEAESRRLSEQLRDSAMNHLARDLTDEQNHDRLTAATAEAAALRQRVEVLEAALKPFAALVAEADEHATKWGIQGPKDTAWALIPRRVGITWGDLRLAWSTLSRSPADAG